MPLINITSPCPMKISGMTPAENGFFCTSCAKVVVDFRNKTDEEVIGYFNRHQGQRTCGIFLPQQASTPAVRSFSVARFLAALLLVFGTMLFTSCGESEPRVTIGDSTRRPNSLEAMEIKARQTADSVRMADSLSELELDGIIAPHDSK